MTLFTKSMTDAGLQEEAVLPSSLHDRPGLIIMVGWLVSLALSWPHLTQVWQNGQFFDTDDAMRLVQIRAWLGGQGWYDLVAHRLHPPEGLLLHWSRVVDVGVGGLIRVFAFFTTAERAETLARIVFPLVLQPCLIALTVTLGRVVAGARATLPAMVLLVTSGFMFEQFPPGRIHHEAPQITIMMGLVTSLLAALSPGRAWLAALAALCLAGSLAIGLEMLPFMAVIIAVAPLVWVFNPAQARPVLLWFAAGLALFCPVTFVASVPASRYLTTACDAFSIAHLAGVCAGAAGCGVLALLSTRLGNRAGRAVALVLVGGAVVAMMATAFPACLRDPYAGMDPMIQRLWLAHVTEAEPLFKASAERPDTFTMLFCPIVLGALGSVAAVFNTTGLARVRWATVLALTIVGIIGMMWEIRVTTSTQPLALMGGVWIVTRAMVWGERRRSALTSVLASALILPFSTMAWAMVPTGPGDRASADALLMGFTCRSPSALSPLAALPPGLVFAPIDDGSHLLVHTPHSVIAAPYHRNQAGNRLVLDGFTAAPQAAEAIVRGSNATYVVICPGETDIEVLARAAPEGLGAALASGSVPAWLVPVPLADTPYKVFMLR